MLFLQKINSYKKRIVFLAVFLAVEWVFRSRIMAKYKCALRYIKRQNGHVCKLFRTAVENAYHCW